MLDAQNPGTATVAAVDIGGTKVAAALVDRTGTVLARAAAPTPARQGADAVLATVADLVRGLVAPDGGRPLALGVGAAGVVDPATGVVLGATDTLTGWAGTDLATGLGDLLGLRVAAANDVHAHGLGESAYGAGRGFASVLTVAVGTGIGGAHVVDGALVPGRHAAAGHVGHVPSAQAAGLLCSCGATGHLEALAAGPGMATEYVRRTGRRVADLRAVAALAADGDATAVQVIADGARAVGEAVAGFVNVLDPDVVVVGGGVAAANDAWWHTLLAAHAAGVLPMLRSTPVLRSTLGGDAALLGAATLAWRTVDAPTPSALPETGGPS